MTLEKKVKAKLGKRWHSLPLHKKKTIQELSRLQQHTQRLHKKHNIVKEHHHLGMS